MTALIKTNGTLWAWGRRLNGSFADGSDNRVSSPVQVLSGTSGWDWVSVINAPSGFIPTGGASSIIAIRTS